jgi:TMEM175 potassium channel family protein
VATTALMRLRTAVVLQRRGRSLAMVGGYPGRALALSLLCGGTGHLAVVRDHSGRYHSDVDAVDIGARDGEDVQAIIGAERLNFFSDAVVAIAITLLALDLPVPGGHSNAEIWRNLGANANDYAAFLISFAVIGGSWLGHHRTFGYLARVNGTLARWTMLWLLMIVVTPFATRTIVGDGAFSARFTLYAGVQALAQIFFLLAVRETRRGGLMRPGTPPAVFTRTYYHTAVGALLFLVSIPLSFVTPWAFACWAAIPFVMRLGRRIGPRLRPL